MLVDEQGKKRAELTMVHGIPSLQFYDEKGEARIEIGYDIAGQPVIELAGPVTAAKPNIDNLLDDPEKFNRLIEWTQKHESVCLWISNEYGPQLRFSDAEGQTRLDMGLYKDDTPSILLLDESGRQRTMIKLSEDGDPIIGLRDGAGKLRTAIGVADLEVTKTGEKRRTAPSTITLFDKTGRSFWQTP